MTVAPLRDRLGSVTALIDIEPEAVALARLRAAETTGRPLGADEFVTLLEDLMRRRLRRQKPGRKARVPESTSEPPLFTVTPVVPLMLPETPPTSRVPLLTVVAPM